MCVVSSPGRLYERDSVACNSRYWGRLHIASKHMLSTIFQGLIIQRQFALEGKQRSTILFQEKFVLGDLAVKTSFGISWFPSHALTPVMQLPDFCSCSWLYTPRLVTAVLSLTCLCAHEQQYPHNVMRSIQPQKSGSGTTCQGVGGLAAEVLKAGAGHMEQHYLA